MKFVETIRTKDLKHFKDILQSGDMLMVRNLTTATTPVQAADSIRKLFFEPSDYRIKKDKKLFLA